jgi:hypothetical protein
VRRQYSISVCLEVTAILVSYDYLLIYHFLRLSYSIGLGGIGSPLTMLFSSVMV